MAALSFRPSCLLLLLVLSVLSTSSSASSSTGEHVRELEVSEGAAVGTRIGYIGEPGASSGPPYLIVPVSGSVEADLSIDRGGEVRTKVSLDREVRAFYSFVAIPLDGGDSSVKVFVHVKVLDENDNAPTFPVASMHVEFPENTPRDVKRTLPPAKDLDLDAFNTQRYRIRSGNVDDAFRLSSHRERDGVLYLDMQINGYLDRETIAAYSLVIEAFDGGAPPLRGSMTVNISIQDVNDNQPVFNQSRYFGSVAENASVGTQVLQVFASDLDAGENGRVTYEINRRQSDRDAMFQIDAGSGVVSVRRPLDFETKELHELVIVARDCGAQPLETTAFVSIRVRDVNDNQPTINVIFLSDDATPKIAEDAQPGEFVARISVHDPDSKAEYANVSVSLSGGDGRFGLTTRDNIVYLVIVSQPLDREVQPAYELRVAATDTGTPPLHATRTISLQVTDVNDNAPVFEADVYRANVLEVSDPGSSVVRVVAHDRDEGDNSVITYSLVMAAKDSHAEWFSVDARSGLVTTRSHIDCETNPLPQLTIAATDSGRPPLSSTTRVYVTIHDVNDNEPIFDQSFYNASVSEGEPVGRCVLKVSATDPDCGVNALVNYTLENGVKEFEVRSGTGEVCIRSPLDFETRSIFEFAVLATDRGGLSTTAMVSIRVMDANDNAPVFYPRTYNVSLSEQQPTTTTSTTTSTSSSSPTPVVIVAATDRDSGRYGSIGYRITAGNDAGLFRIDRATGEIFVTRPSMLSARSKRYHRLNISASDGGGLKARRDAEVLISVIDSAQKPPIFQYARYTFSAREDVRRGTIVGSVKAAIAGETALHSSAAIRYSIYSGDPDGLFSIDVVTGSIRTSAPLDHETHVNVLLNVQATSGHEPPVYGHSQVNVEIEDVNDNAPEFESSTVRISVPENVDVNATLFAAHANDPDADANGVVTYRLLGAAGTPGGGNLFQVHAATGHVSLVRALDFEHTQRHSLIISASDSGRPSLSANLTLLIDVQDVNDNAPVFERADYEIKILETMPINAQIIQVTAIDSDSGNNARLTYRFIAAGGIGNGTMLTDAIDAFGIFPNTGLVYLKRALDREERARYELPVVATDNGTPAASASTRVLVHVLDANDNDPVFAADSYDFAVEENRGRGAFVGVVSARDADEGMNGAVVYALVAANSSFQINPNTGVITTRNALDREHCDLHELVVEARDQGTPPRHSRLQLHVHVLDVNDNAPDIVDPQEDVISVREEQPPGTEVVHVRAIDVDKGNNATITYTLQQQQRDPDALAGSGSGGNAFAIDASTGVVRTRMVLELEAKTVYRLVVTASDNGVPPKRSQRTLRVEVLDVNDNRPTFTSSSLSFRVREDVAVGYVAGSIAPTYAGEHGTAAQTGQITYTLSTLLANDALPDVFDVDRSSGSLIVARKLDRERQAEYKLEVRALDTSTVLNPQSSVVTVRVDIADANDNAPHWQQDPVTIEVAEDVRVGKVVHNFTASDLDAGSNGDLRYQLMRQQPNDVGGFAIDAMTGALTITHAFDFEVHEEYTLIVLATDQSLNASERLSSTLTAIVRVRDVNDNAPQFVQPAAAAADGIRFASTTSIGAPIGYVLAMDRDAGDNAIVNYVISNGNENGYFALSYESGVLSLAKSINLAVDSAAKSHRLNITASDRGRPSLSTHQQFTLSVNDMAETSPRFAQNTYHAEIAENATPGTFVAKLALPQSASGKHREGAFFIPPGVANDTFAIHPENGNVTTLKALDRETTPAYLFPIYISANEARDHIMAMLKVRVTDVNDHAPTFHSGACYALSVPENSESSVIHTAVADDLDTDMNGLITYAIVAGNTGNKFSVNAHSGEITARSLDREAQSRYHLHIVAQDKGTPPLQGACNLTVFVEDRNDNDPIFDSHSYAASINEDVAADTSVLKVSAHDADVGLNARIVYSIANESQMFRIDNRTGVIWTSGAFDRETQEVYNFLVLAADSGRSQIRTQQVPVRVTIGDVNDNRPQFSSYPYREKITAYLQPGQAIAKVSASDADSGMNAEILYSLAPHSDAKFSINPNTGVVSATQSLAHENGKTVRLHVIATDKGIPAASERGLVELMIGDVPRGQQTSLTFQNATYYITTPENADEATYLTQVSAVRSDGRKQRMSYMLGHEASGAFAIDAETGVIRIRNASLLDYEAHKQMEFVVSAASESTTALYAYCNVVVHLTDQNDNAPKFTQQEYLVPVLEGKAKGTFVIRALAIDADEDKNAMIRYHIVDGNHDNAFKIEPAFSGIIKTSIVLDREIRDTYRLTVIAIDEGVPQMTGTARIRINVLDVNDNSPSFPPNSAVHVPEDATVGSVLTTVSANDVDTSPALVYNFTEDVDAHVRHNFSIDRYSGKVVLRQPLDYEAWQEYKLQILASDGIHQAQTILTIKVTDVNDNRPEFLQTSYQATISMGNANNVLQTVLTINATDADSGDNGQLKYSLRSPIDGFQIDPIDGVVRVNSSILAKHEGVHYITVKAEDQGKPALSATTVLRISIPSGGGNFPGVSGDSGQRELKANVLENATVGESILSLPSVLDESDLSYYIIAGNDANQFEVINKNVVVVAKLDREMRDTYKLEIACSTCSNANLNVHIDIADVNDNRPQFTLKNHQIIVNESVPLESELMTVEAIDADLANTSNSKIIYEITSGNDLALFTIGKLSGVLAVANALDYDSQYTFHNLIVRACDMGAQPLCALTHVRVLLEDVNDNSPQFPVSEYLEFVAENEPIGSSVFIARATDLDAGLYGNVNYSITSVNNHNYPIDDATKLFSIDRTSGLVVTNVVFDYEVRNRYVFLIRAMDIGGRMAEVRVRLEIESRDEFYPHFTEKTYKFSLPVQSSGFLPSGLIVGQVTATDRDRGPDGRVVYQLSSQNAHFKMNRTTGAIIIKKKLELASFGREISLVVTASSGRQNSLTNMTVVELTFDENGDVGLNMAINNQTIAADAGGISDWALGLLIAVLLLLITFGALFVFLHMKNKRNKKVNKPNMGPQEQMNVTTNNYVDPSAFDTIPIRGNSGQFAPPKYDEIPPYAAAASSNSGAATTSELSGSEQSGSSGRGSAEDVDDNEDEEIRMINEGPLKQRQKDEDNLSDVSVRNTQEYLARLGIVNNLSSNPAGPQTSRIGQVPLESLLFDEDSNCDDIANFYAKLNDVASSDRASNADDPVGTVVTMDHMMSGYGQIPNHQPSMNGSLSSIVHSEEELAGSYNWDYLLDWGPQYQPLAHVFSEIARLKDDTASVQSGASGSSAKSKASQPKTMPPPLITSIAPRLNPRGGSNHHLSHINAVMPRSPIHHELGSQYNGSAVMSPSFSPSLSPLATKSPSISPLVAPGLSAAHHVRQAPTRAKNAIDNEMRI